jgi:hypothetical protein
MKVLFLGEFTASKALILPQIFDSSWLPNEFKGSMVKTVLL